MIRPERPSNGYTLVEMLAALLVLGLAMTALTQATRTFAQTGQRASRSIAAVTSARTVETFLRRQLGPGPFVSAANASEAVLQGEERRVLYDCGAPRSCELLLRDGATPRLERVGGMSVPLPARGLRFHYIAAETEGPTFPVGDSEDSLTAIALVDASGSAVALWRTAAHQSATCAFDGVNHRCFPSPGQVRQ